MRSSFVLVRVASLLLMTPSAFSWVQLHPSVSPVPRSSFSLPNRRILHPRPSTASSAALSESAKTADPNLFDTLLSWFQGDFDNYRQVVADRANGLLPREGGGHEHIHCSLVPVTHNSRLAAFYFDGYPIAIFRFRYYRFESVPDSTAVNTVLYTLSNELEGKMRACADPLQWPRIFTEYVEQAASQSGVAASEDTSLTAVTSGCVQLLPKCEVQWSWARDPIQHAYAAGFRNGGIHAVMVHGESVVDSQMLPGQKILIKDQLSMWQDQLWIHDRGFDPATGDFIYGNQRGVPYMMQRVASIDKQPLQRHVTDQALAWTMGRDYCSLHEYEQNMQVIGGSSRPVRK